MRVEPGRSNQRSTIARRGCGIDLVTPTKRATHQAYVVHTQSPAATRSYSSDENKTAPAGPSPAGAVSLSRYSFTQTQETTDRR